MSGLKSTQHLLKTFFENPQLAQQIQSFSPDEMGRLIQRLGWADSDVLIQLVSPAQLLQLADDLLFDYSAHSQSPNFDPDRFLSLVMALDVENDSRRAELLSTLPEDTLAYGIHQHILVLDYQQLVTSAAFRGPEENDTIEKLLESHPSEQLKNYFLISRRGYGWSTISGLLIALEQEHFELQQRLLHRCVQLNRPVLCEEGLYELLCKHQEVFEELLERRESRRRNRGYIPHYDAQEYLKTIEQSTLDELTRNDYRGLFLRYQRDLQPGLFQTNLRFVDALSFAKERQARQTMLTSQLERVLKARNEEPDWYQESIEELIFLANVLVASGQQRDHLKAAQQVLNTVELGFTKGEAGRQDWSMTQLFQCGWKRLRAPERDSE